MQVISHRDGEHYTMEFSRGHVTKGLTNLGKSKKHGTIISFIPDEKIFGEYVNIDPEKLKDNIELRSYINGGVKFELKIDSEKFTYQHDDGIKDYIKKLNPESMTDEVYLSFTDDADNQYEIIFNYSNTIGENIHSFVNGIVTSKGTHEAGFKRGLTMAIQDAMKTMTLPKKFEKIEVTGNDIREGLYAVINLRLQKPEFRGQVKDELSNTEVQGEIQVKVRESMTEFLKGNPEITKKLINRILLFAKGRNDANNMKSKVISVGNVSSGLKLPEKFDDCISDVPSECEIIVIEGDSAGGGVKSERIPQTQAVYPLKGKPLNAYSSTTVKMLSNNEMNELILILFGTNDLKSIDVARDIKYHKFIILADSDNDGYHIVSLLLAFIKKYFPEMIELGYVYICKSPLYRITVGGKFIYFKDDNEYDKYISKEISKRYKLTGGMPLPRAISVGEKYMVDFNLVQNRYHINPEILDYFVEEIYTKGELDVNEIEGIFSNVGLSLIDTNRGLLIEGLYDGLKWQSFILNEDVLDDVVTLAKHFKDKDNFNGLELTDNKTKEVIQGLSFREVYNTLVSAIKFERVRFKGLGEADPEELGETTLSPEGRELIQVQMKDVENADTTTEIFFGKSTDKRKDFIDENL